MVILLFYIMYNLRLFILYNFKTTVYLGLFGFFYLHSTSEHILTCAYMYEGIREVRGQHRLTATFFVLELYGQPSNIYQWKTCTLGWYLITRQLHSLQSLHGLNVKR
mgnify:CR=1 FL=1